MTIPINPVSIRPEFVQTQENPQPGMELLLRALQHRQELDIEKQKLQRQQEQFELNKRIAGPQVEGMELENIKRKRDLQQNAESIEARNQALQLYTGNLPRADDLKAWGEVMAGVKDPLVAGHLMEYIKEYFQTQALRTNWQTVPTAQGTYAQINPETGATRPTNLQVPPDAGLRRIPVMGEREKASGFIASVRANEIANRVETADPTVGARVARIVGRRKAIIGGIGRRLAGATEEQVSLEAEAQIEQSMTPVELEYYTAAKQYLGSILPALSGKVVTAREYLIHAPVFFSMGATTPAVTKNRRRARATRIRSFYEESGGAANERLPELGGVDLSEYGLGPPKAQAPDPSRYYRP